MGKSSVEQSTVLVDRMYHKSSILTKEDHSEDPIEVRQFPADIPQAKVRCESSMTINLGNFESVKVGVSVELPCVVEEISECYSAVKNLVDLRLNTEVTAIREYRDKKNASK
jgi:hypothetical protein